MEQRMRCSQPLGRREKEGERSTEGKRSPPVYWMLVVPLRRFEKMRATG